MLLVPRKSRSLARRVLKSGQGFTLIELLVVISIIGILSSVILASLSTARTRAYDAQRKNDLKKLQIELEFYYDRFNTYPSTGGAWYGLAAPATVVTEWIPNLISSGQLLSLPQDPQHGKFASPNWPCSTWPSEYLYRSVDGTGYALLVHCPQQSSVGTTPTTDPFYDPARPTWGWKVCVGNECSG